MIKSPTKIKQKKDINIGIIIFLFILIYIGICVYIFFTKSEVSLYVVRPGTLFSDKTYTGIILRTEETVNTNMAGYVNYYFQEGDRISKNETVYSIDSDKSIYDKLSGDGSEIMLNSEDLIELKGQINKAYRNAQNFKDYKELKDSINVSYTRQLDKRLIQNLNKLVRESNIDASFEVIKSEKAGIVSFCFDSLSELTEEALSKDLFDNIEEEQVLYTSDLLETNAPVYKIITEDDWKIAVMIDEELFYKLHDKDSVSFTINSEQTITAPVKVLTKKEEYYAVISLSKYITNYTDCRYVDISFDTAKTEGLKLPLSAIAYKNYYRVPSEYFTYDSKENSVFLSIEFYDKNSGERAYKQTETEVFYDDGAFKYIDCNLFPEETYILVGGGNRIMLNTYITKLEGAYNINDGYAVFKRIERLETNDEYTLIRKNSTSGLAEFDHVALDVLKIKEGEVIY